MEYVACNLCGSSQAVPVQQAMPDLLFRRNDILSTFVRCISCGLVYQNPRPTLAEISVYYPPDYESYAIEPALQNSSWLRRQTILYGLAKRCRYVKRYKRAGRLLDVGCATGVFLREMQHCGNWETCGVEVSEHASRIARGYGLDVRLGTLEQAEFPDEFFDVVTLWDVLEHLHDPAASLREIYRILKPDGLLVIRVPNADSWDARVFGRYWAGWDAPRHLYVFTPTTLGALLTTNHFRIVAQDSRIGAYPAFLLSLRFWNYARNKSSLMRDRLIQLLDQPAMRMLTAPLFYLRSLGLQGPLLVTTARRMG